MTRIVAALTIGLVILYGCTGPSPTRPTQPSVSAAERAQQLLDMGRYEEAADIYLQLAQRRPQRAQEWQLQAASAYLEAGRPDRTRLLLSGLQGSLNQVQQAMFNLLTAASDPNPQDYRTLQQLSFDAELLPTTMRARYHEVKANAFLNGGNPYASALERISLSRLLDDPQKQLDNDQALVNALRQLSQHEASTLLARHQPREEIFGWLALIADLKQAVFSGNSASDAVALWASRFPDHPANRQSVADLLLEYELTVSQPNRIALLIPANGRLASAARSIRDGVFAAHFESGGSGSISLYDTGGTANGAVLAYQQAMADEVTHIIGPLEKSAVDAVIRIADGDIPVIALNYADSQTPNRRGIYQFGLAPEDEARSAAEQMVRNGHLRAAVLTASGDWGNRIQNAFAERFQSLGGRITSTGDYPASLRDFSNLIPNLVGLTQSQQRQREIQRIVNSPLAFTAQRRHDLDAVFLAARSTSGRLIKPQFAFFNASDLPIYATSHIYAGKREPEADRDLNGTRFCDAPFMLDGQAFQPGLNKVRDWFPKTTQGSAARLFALGMDAYRVIPYLDWLRSDRGDSFPGATGSLTIDSNGKLVRQPDCAQFRRGVAQSIGVAAAGEN